jgi:hypothetical protein
MIVLQKEYDREDLASFQQDASREWVDDGKFHWAAYSMGIPGKFRVTIEFFEEQKS